MGLFSPPHKFHTEFECKLLKKTCPNLFPPPVWLQKCSNLLCFGSLSVWSLYKLHSVQSAVR